MVGIRWEFACEVEGSERYGFENVDDDAEYRGMVRGARPGDEVEVWSAAWRSELGRASASSRAIASRTPWSATPTIASIVADEDDMGMNPTILLNPPT